jgi:hypothetical protein
MGQAGIEPAESSRQRVHGCTVAVDGTTEATAGRQPVKVQRCRRCTSTRTPDEYAWTRGLCPACLELDRQQRRSNTGRRLLDRAKDAGTVDRDGQTYHGRRPTAETEVRPPHPLSSRICRQRLGRLHPGVALVRSIRG